MRTAGPAGRATASTDFSSNAGWERCSRGTSCCRTPSTVSDGGRSAVPASMPLSFSVMLTCGPRSATAQPSGCVNRYPATLFWYGMNATLSGMSPGGLLSTGTGAWLAPELPAAVEAGGLDAAVVPVAPGELVDELPLHAVTTKNPAAPATTAVDFSVLVTN